MVTQLEIDIYGYFRKMGRFLYDNTGGKSGQRRVLFFLSKEGSMSQRELQSLLDVKSSSLSEMITKMENAGLIKKTRSKKDQRVILLSLSEKGKKEADRECDELNYITEHLFSCLSKQEEQDIYRFLEKLNTHWEQLKRDEVFHFVERER